MLEFIGGSLGDWTGPSWNASGDASAHKLVKEPEVKMLYS